MTDDLTRDFKGIWIPKEIWLDERLNTIDKIILLEIDSLDIGESGCYASNKYLADFCKCTETTVSTSVSKLIKLEYLEVIKFDGRKRYLKSRLSKIERQTLKNLKADLKNFKGSIYNNIDNNIINNIKENKKEKYGTYGRIKLKPDEYLRLIDEFGKDFIDKQIQLLDEYVESNNNKNKYTNFNLVLRKSIREKWFNKNNETFLPDWFNKEQKVNTSNNTEKEIENILKEMESD